MQTESPILKYLGISFLISILLLVAGITEVYAQWLDDGAHVCIYDQDQLNPKITSDGAGGAIIAWEDGRGSGGDIYAQRISAGGVPIWYTNGVPATGLGNVEDLIGIVPDGSDGVYIFWWIDAPLQYYDICRQQLAGTDGSQQFGPGGQTVWSNLDWEYEPTWSIEVMSDGANGAFLTVWNEWGDFDISYKHINMCSGKLGREIWSGVRWYDIAIDPAAGILCSWTTFGLDDVDTVLVEKHGLDCTRVWSRSVYINPIFEPSPGGSTVESDGTGGAVIVYTLSSDIYASRVDETGALLWSGRPICQADHGQGWSRIVADGTGGGIVVWKDWRHDPNGNGEIYAQRFYPDGTVPFDLSWEPEGNAIRVGKGYKENWECIPDGGGGAIIVWEEDHQNNGDWNIYAQKINAEGILQWPTAENAVICAASGSQQSSDMVTDGVGGAIITWSDGREANVDIYAQGTAAGVDPICSVSPSTIEFDTLEVGEFQDAVFTITNIGGGTLTGSVGESSDHYDILSGAGPFSLLVGQSKDVTVRFFPEWEGSHDCFIKTGISCDDVACIGFCGEDVIVVPGYTQMVQEAVDSTGNVGQYTSLALDAMGNPHISYFDITNGSLKYVTKANGGWLPPENVDTEVDSFDVVGLYTSIEIDAEGIPHISYLADTPHLDLRYAVRIGGSWSVETVDSTGDVGYFSSLALDPQGNPHISYFDATNNFIMYATKQGTSWTKMAVDSLGGPFCYTSIAVDALGVPHISYRYYSEADLMYAVKIGGVWSRRTIDANGVVGYYTSIAIDFLGNPHISYYDLWHNDLKYAKRQDGIWSFETIDDTGVVGSYTAIALDAEGNPHISYWDETNGDLKYAVKDGIVWSVETLDATGIVGSHSSLALDVHGNPHISYYDESNGDLRYASGAVYLVSPVGDEHWSAGGQETVTWEGAGEIDILLSQDGGATYVPLLSSVSGGIATVNVPGWATDLARVKIVRESPYSTSESPGVFSIGLEKAYPGWSTAVDVAGTQGYYTSLALGANGEPHISYYSPAAVALKYAAKTGGSWTKTIVPDDSVGLYTSLALDADGEPHISYYDHRTEALKYAEKSSGSWSVELVDSDGNVGGYTSIALDNLGYPHISYYDASYGRLKYAVKYGSWIIEYPDTNLVYGPGTSIAVDAEGNPHISYYGHCACLMYAWKDHGIWQSGIIDDTGTVGAWSSIALDAQGRAHISYQDAGAGELKYVMIDQDWSVQTIDDMGQVGAYSSIAVDPEGNPFIAYFDETNQTLKIAFMVGDSWTIVTPDEENDVGKYPSIALDEQGNVRVSYYDITNRDLKYVSTAIEISEPSPGTTWPVGAERVVTWNGIGNVDISASVDGGASYGLIASGISGGRYRLTVPHTPSRFCKVKLERTIEANTFGISHYPHSISVSDSFFTIETSVELLSMMVTPSKEGEGNLVTWKTDPGPEDLQGYRLEKKKGSDEWFALLSRTKETSYHDVDGVSGDRYRLFAINGLGEEFYMGEASDGEVPSFGGRLVVWPLPFQGGELNISFPTSHGGTPIHTEVVLYDVAGRRIKTLAEGVFQSAARQIKWDGRDDNGNLLASGIYFLRASSKVSQQTLKLVIVR
jgi:hypothetical protein